MIGYFHHWMGEFRPAREQCEQAPGLCELGSPQLLASVDQRSLALGYLPLDLMILGYPDQALSRYEHSWRCSKSRRHPFSTAYTLLQTAHLQILRRDYERAWWFSMS
jgi:hypothetical protein